VTDTVETLLAGGTAKLAASDSARGDALWLLAQVLRRDRAWILAHGDSHASSALAERFYRLCGDRASGKPLAYVLGSVGFYGREFSVDQRVLVPRPETEHLIDEALPFLHARRNAAPWRGLRALEIGVGSGAIACTLAAECDAVLVDGTDVSSDAVEVARFNARKHHVADRCRFYRGEFASPVLGRRYDLVLANLPYIPTSRLPQPPDPVAFEPRPALDGGRDGLDAYRQFLANAPDLIEPGGLLLLEAAPPQMAGLRRLTKRAFALAKIEVGTDYARKARYLKVVTPVE
jgi:release factor glutamine methyltransferase